jgi:hypothetical protein
MIGKVTLVTALLVSGMAFAQQQPGSRSSNRLLRIRVPAPSAGTLQPIKSATKWPSRGKPSSLETQLVARPPAARARARPPVTLRLVRQASPTANLFA